MIWVFWICLTLALWLVADDPKAKYCLALTAAGLLLMQVFKIADLGHWQWLASASLWAAISVASSRQVVTFSVLTLFSAMCYLWGRVAGFSFADAPPPLLAADLFGLAALLTVGGPGVCRMVGTFRDRHLGKRVP